MEEVGRSLNFHVQIFLVLTPAHFARLTYRLIAVKAENRITALSPIFLRSSCSGSAAQWRNVTTSLAIWEVVAGVPGGGKPIIVRIIWDPEGASLTVFVLNQPVEQDACHRYSTTGEEWIIIHSITDFNASRGVNITSEQGEDVVLQRKSGHNARGYKMQLTRPPWRALTIKLRSGGRAPALEALAASSLG